MANFADVIGRIETVLNRRNSSYITQLATTYALDRIYFYSNYAFAPSEQTNTSLILQPGQAIYEVPAGTYQVLFVRVNQNGTWIPLTRVIDYREFLYWDVSTPPSNTTPAMYGMLGNKIRFFPRPGSPYTIELTIEGQPLPPRNLTDSNFWTNEALTLISEAAAEDISRLVLSDEPRANRHAQAVQRELLMLGSQTMRLLGPLRPNPYL